MLKVTKTAARFCTTSESKLFFQSEVESRKDPPRRRRSPGSYYLGEREHGESGFYRRQRRTDWQIIFRIQRTTASHSVCSSARSLFSMMRFWCFGLARSDHSDHSERWNLTKSPIRFTFSAYQTTFKTIIYMYSTCTL